MKGVLKWGGMAVLLVVIVTMSAFFYVDSKFEWVPLPIRVDRQPMVDEGILLGFERERYHSPLTALQDGEDPFDVLLATYVDAASRGDAEAMLAVSGPRLKEIFEEYGDRVLRMTRESYGSCSSPLVADRYPIESGGYLYALHCEEGDARVVSILAGEGGEGPRIEWLQTSQGKDALRLNLISRSGEGVVSRDLRDRFKRWLRATWMRSVERGSHLSPDIVASVTNLGGKPLAAESLPKGERLQALQAYHEALLSENATLEGIVLDSDLERLDNWRNSMDASEREELKNFIGKMKLSEEVRGDVRSYFIYTDGYGVPSVQIVTCLGERDACTVKPYGSQDGFVEMLQSTVMN